mmetsp:Transcript_23431/g.53467  ORF Transcript_23431/g.53467 Transcript_23431/m.53467 type:complete len:206 (+) Transcript_23431:882-1499(+)
MWFVPQSQYRAICAHFRAIRGHFDLDDPLRQDHDRGENRAGPHDRHERPKHVRGVLGVCPRAHDLGHGRLRRTFLLRQACRKRHPGDVLQIRVVRRVEEAEVRQQLVVSEGPADVLVQLRGPWDGPRGVHIGPHRVESAGKGGGGSEDGVANRGEGEVAESYFVVDDGTIVSFQVKTSSVCEARAGDDGRRYCDYFQHKGREGND